MRGWIVSEFVARKTTSLKGAERNKKKKPGLLIMTKWDGLIPEVLLIPRTTSEAELSKKFTMNIREKKMLMERPDDVVSRKVEDDDGRNPIQTRVVRSRPSYSLD